jgi:hypothetical protein
VGPARGVPARRDDVGHDGPSRRGSFYPGLPQRPLWHVCGFPAWYRVRLRALPAWNEKIGRVFFVACWANIALLALLSLLSPGGPTGVVLYLLFWIGVTLVLPLVLRTPLRPLGYLAAVAVLALIEETAVYYVGGGLQGAATSLPEDWVGSVPTFVGLGAALLLSVRRLGLSSSEVLAAAAASGIFIELGPGAGFSPVAFIAFGGAVA